MHIVAYPYLLGSAAKISWDNEAVCFHVNFPWKPHNYGRTIGEIERLPACEQGCLYGLDTVEEVVDGVIGLSFYIYPDALQEIRRREQLHLFYRARL